MAEEAALEAADRLWAGAGSTRAGAEARGGAPACHRSRGLRSVDAARPPRPSRVRMDRPDGNRLASAADGSDGDPLRIESPLRRPQTPVSDSPSPPLNVGKPGKGRVALDRVPRIAIFQPSSF